MAFAPLIGLLVGVLAQVAVYRLFGRLPVVVSYAAGTLLACATTAGVIMFSSKGHFDVADQAVGFLTVAGLTFCYNNLVNIFYSSLRVRLLCRLSKAGGSMAESDFLGCYGSGDVVTDRLARLVDWGQLRKEGDRYYAAPGWLAALSRLYLGLKRLFLRRGFRFETEIGETGASPQ
jgi:hypothetical protein